MNKRCEVIIVAGGQGTRMGTSIPKAFLELEGRPIFAYTIEIFSKVEEISGIILVVPSGMEEKSYSICSEIKGSEKITSIVAGGASRQDSVRAGMDSLNPDTDIVLIHDAARIFTSEALVRSIISSAREYGAAVPGLPVADTIKRVSEDNKVVATIERSHLVAIQTPQGFKRDLLTEAYNKACESKLTATDDAALVENFGSEIKVVDGERFNFKLTTPRDMELAIALLKSRKIDGWKES